MTRIALWWILFAILLIGTSAFRYHVRHNFGAGDASGALMPATETLLRDSPYNIVGPIQDELEGHIGFRFQHPSCDREMRVVAFTLGSLADPFSDDYMTANDQRRYFYYDLSYTDSARIATTLTWVKHKAKDRLRFTKSRTSSRQFVVIWPETCSEPSIDWSRAWQINSRYNEVKPI